MDINIRYKAIVLWSIIKGLGEKLGEKLGKTRKIK